MSQRVSLVDLEGKNSGSRAVYFIFFSLFFIITLVTFYHFFIKENLVDLKQKISTSVLTPTSIPTPTPLPGLFSPDKKFRVLRVNNQLQIFEGNSDKLLFKLFDRVEIINKNSTASAKTKTGQYLPEKWSDDSRSLVYKLVFSDSSNFGLIYLNTANVFVANPDAVAHYNCAQYSWSPDYKKIIFYNHISDAPCLGTLINFNSVFSVRDLGINATKNGQTYQSVENAFWDSDSKKVNINLNIGKLNNGLDRTSSRTETRIIAL